MPKNHSCPGFADMAFARIGRKCITGPVPIPWELLFNPRSIIFRKELQRVWALIYLLAYSTISFPYPQNSSCRHHDGRLYAVSCTATVWQTSSVFTCTIGPIYLIEEEECFAITPDKPSGICGGKYFSANVSAIMVRQSKVVFRE